MHRMAFRGALLGLVAMVLGCTPVEPETYPASIAPILPSEGVISSRNFLRLFADDCLRSFPDQDAIGAAFLEDGFSVLNRDHVANGFWSLDRRSDDLHASASVAGTVPTRPGASPPEWTDCHLSGGLADPDQFALALFEMVDAAGESLHWEEGEVMRTSFSRGDATLYLSARLPVLVLRPYHVDVAGICGELPRCQTWGAAQIAVHLESDYPI